MNELTIIEREGKRVLTTQQLGEAYGVDDKKIRDNFTNNKSRYIEGKHYLKLEGEELKRFKNDTEIFGVVGDRTSSVYLWTEAGALHHAKSLGTDKAWEVFEQLEETYFRVKEQIQSPMQQLSPQLQLLINMELEQKKLRQQLNEVNHNALKAKAEAEMVKEEVQAIRDVIVINPKAEWRKQANKILNSIGYKTKEYQMVKDEVYKALGERAKCDLKRRLENLQGRALRQGMAPSLADELNYLDVIENDIRLKEIYIAIVKEMAIKNGVYVREGQA